MAVSKTFGNFATMKKFGNIVSESVRISTPIPLQLYKTLEEVEDRSIPTLIIGLDNAKKYINGFNILTKWYPDQNIGWTFTKTERAADQQIDIEYFCNGLIKNILNSCTYRLVDIVNLTRSRLKAMIEFVNNQYDKYVFIDRNAFMFIYSIEHRRTYGIPLNTCRYCGIDSDKVIKKVLSNPHNQRVKNFQRIPFTVKDKLGDALHTYFAVLEYFKS